MYVKSVSLFVCFLAHVSDNFTLFSGLWNFRRKRALVSSEGTVEAHRLRRATKPAAGEA